jgi:quercetin 2,3-dioxygenase
MMTIRSARERGRTKLSWLDSRHSFSFGEYHDPQHMGFRTLRVINDDRVAPGGGFGTHAHRDMEIVTYVLDGALEHKDSLGNGSIIQPGDAQRMSAGSGIRHSEFNHSQVDPVRFLQIWILPERQGLPPGYEQRTLPAAESAGQLRLIASRDGRDGSITVHQDAAIYAAVVRPGDHVRYAVAPDRHAWLQVARGPLTLGSHTLQEGDGVAMGGETTLDVTSTATAEILLFDLG